uniref:Uncharacterized protein n=1 Tax=Mus musculus TaxID=10090 RepID=Q3UR52_MOUSE|nr:unnamed protein product [Mus musculus]
MAPNTMWSILSSLSSEVPSSDDRTMRVILWGGKKRSKNEVEVRPGKRSQALQRLWAIPMLLATFCWERRDQRG